MALWGSNTRKISGSVNTHQSFGATVHCSNNVRLFKFENAINSPDMAAVFCIVKRHQHDWENELCPHTHWPIQAAYLTITFCSHFSLGIMYKSTIYW